jgi:hypothetical protein
MTERSVSGWEETRNEQQRLSKKLKNSSPGIVTLTIDLNSFPPFSRDHSLMAAEASAQTSAAFLTSASLNSLQIRPLLCHPHCCSLFSLCENIQSYILSYLDSNDIISYGQTCTELHHLSKLPHLWCNIHLSRAKYLSLQQLSQFILRSCPKIQPLKQLILLGNNEFNSLTPSSSSSSLSYDDLLSSSSSPPLTLSTSCHCTLSEICDFCKTISPSSTSPPSASLDLSRLSSHLHSLQDLQFTQIQCLNSSTFYSLLSHTPRLLSISIENNIDVNLIIHSIASSCPQLLSLSFNYIDVLTFDTDESALEYPLLSSAASHELVLGCPLIKFLRLCHYTIDDEGVRMLLNLSHVESVDFSDNESLHGEFLTQIPVKWPQLRSLIFRDCLEIEDEHVSAFALRVAQGGCPFLCYVDCSCQWSFYQTSLLFPPVREELNKFRGPAAVAVATAAVTPPHLSLTSIHLLPTGVPLRWREDQCEIEGFGVDPEDGVELHHFENERLRSHSLCGNDLSNLKNGN